MWLGMMRLWVQSLALLSGLKTQCCHELWGRSQRWLGSGIAVPVAGSCSSDSIPSLGTSTCLKGSPKKQKKKKLFKLRLLICQASNNGLLPKKCILLISSGHRYDEGTAALLKIKSI